MRISSRHRSRFALPALVVLTIALSSAVAAEAWLRARPDFQWSFPADHWSHPGYRTEWWYFTGHLESAGESPRRFGYQFTFFRVGLTPDAPAMDSAWGVSDLVMGHASISDLDAGEHYFSELLYRATPFLGGFSPPGDSLVAWSRAPAGSEGRWTLHRTSDGFAFAMRDDTRDMAFTLSVRPLKPMVLQGEGGFSPKGHSPEAASQYYSYTRMETRGELKLGDERLRVRGQSWMDREFGSNQLTENQVGWDWFSLQFADGRDLMLYVMRDRRGAVDFAKGTLVEADGRYRPLTQNDWRLEIQETWPSPDTGARYPVRWRLRLAAEDIDVEVKALLPNQENVSRLSGGVNYWEGAVGLRPWGEEGALIGRGYVEMTGYGEGSRPPL